MHSLQMVLYTIVQLILQSIFVIVWTIDSIEKFTIDLVVVYNQSQNQIEIDIYTT